MIIIINNRSGPEGRPPRRGRRRQDGRPQRGEQAAGQEDPERAAGGPGMQFNRKVGL